jgi:hypothetical protein
LQSDLKTLAQAELQIYLRRYADMPIRSATADTLSHG